MKNSFDSLSSLLKQKLEKLPEKSIAINATQRSFQVASGIKKESLSLLSHCLLFEDAMNEIKSALSAGMRAV
ncbi:hypothetical protein RhiirA4_481653 [Rhizophagus irregularis]|uniref:Uncharacterized protein n=1 Tax=Rhizophagus irregularis TaxID=588596 RepID=A0A2I1HJW8_9GLOM|nr:hypothetical protein RhiirA4_481653 [Rhizophagus irregularis]